MEEEVDDVVGPKGKWHPERTAVRHVAGVSFGEVPVLPTLAVAIARRLRLPQPTPTGEAPIAVNM